MLRQQYIIRRSAYIIFSMNCKVHRILLFSRPLLCYTKLDYIWFERLDPLWRGNRRTSSWSPNTTPVPTRRAFWKPRYPIWPDSLTFHVVTRAVDERMSRILPNGVTFLPPGHPRRQTLPWAGSGLSAGCPAATASSAGPPRRRAAGTAFSAAHALDALVESELLPPLHPHPPGFAGRAPAGHLFANFNDYLYGLCRIKEMGKDIHVAAQLPPGPTCSTPQTGERRGDAERPRQREDRRPLLYLRGAPQRLSSTISPTALPPANTGWPPLGCAGTAGAPRPAGRGLRPPDRHLFRRSRKTSGCRFFIEAMSRMKVGVFEWVHIGDGSEREAVEKLAAEKLGDKPGIKYQFFRLHVPGGALPVLRRTPPRRLPLGLSSSESVPSLMLEAMANRIFVCATAVDGVTDVSAMRPAF